MFIPVTTKDGPAFVNANQVVLIEETGCGSHLTFAELTPPLGIKEMPSEFVHRYNVRMSQFANAHRS